MLIAACLVGALGAPALLPPALADPALMRYVKKASGVRYTENAGQWDARAKFHAVIGGADVWLTSTGIEYGFHGPTPKAKTPALPGERAIPEPTPIDRVEINFIGAHGTAKPVGIGELPGIYRYYLGKHGGQIAHSFGAAEIKDLYSGIDLVSYPDANENRPRYDLIVHPGADASQIRMRYTGAQNLRVTKEGEVQYNTAYGQVSEQRQLAYQSSTPERRRTESAVAQAEYRFFPRQVMNKDDDKIGFNVDGYLKDRTLVIDPLIWSTYLGGSGSTDEVTRVKVDTNGNTYVCGYTDSSTFLPGGTDGPGGTTDAYVAKFTSGGALTYGIYYGGSNYNNATGVGFDAAGNAYICGDTGSRDLDVTDGSTNTGASGGDAFMAKFDAANGSLKYAEYLGYAGLALSFPYGTNGYGLVVTSTGTCYAALAVYDGPFSATTDGNITKAFLSAFVVEVSSTGVPMGSFDLDRGANTKNPANYGGTSISVLESAATAIAIDPGSGNIFVAATADASTLTGSQGTATTGIFRFGYQPAIQTVGSAPLILKLSSDLTTLLGATYLSGSADAVATDIAVDSTGAPYVTGYDESDIAGLPFPTITGAYDTSYTPGDRIERGFISKLSSDLNTLVYSTTFKSTGLNSNSLALDASNNPVIVGITGSGLPLTGNAFQSTPAWGFLAQFRADLSTLNYSTYFGDNTGSDSTTTPLGVAVDASGNFYLGGFTSSTTFPTMNAYQSSYGGGATSGFVSVLNPPALAPFATLTSTRGATPQMSGGVGSSFVVTATFPANAGGTVTLTPADATVLIDAMASSSYTLKNGQTTQTFKITAPGDVASTHPVVLTASGTGLSNSTMTLRLQPYVQSIVFDTASINSDDQFRAIVYTFEAPGKVQTLTFSSNSSDVTPPANVSCGSMSSGYVFFHIGSPLANETATGTCSLVGGASSATSSFKINAATISSVSCNPPRVYGGGNSTVTVNLTAVSIAGETITLTSSNSSLVPNVTVTVPPNSAVGTGTATTTNTATTAYTPVTLTGTLNSVSTPGTLQVSPAAITAITLNTRSVNAGYPNSITVTVSGPQPAVQMLTITSNSTSVPNVSVTIPANATSSASTPVPTNFAVSTANSTVTLTGVYGGTTTNSLPFTVVSDTVSSLAMTSGASTSFSELDTPSITATLAFAPPVGTSASVPVTSGNTAVIPSASIPVAATSTTGAVTLHPSFTALTAPLTFHVSAGAQAIQGVVVTVNPEIISPLGLASSVTHGTTATATITLFEKWTGADTATLTSFSPLVATIIGPASIALKNGTTTITFQVNALTPGTSRIRVQALGYVRDAILTVN